MIDHFAHCHAGEIWSQEAVGRFVVRAVVRRATVAERRGGCWRQIDAVAVGGAVDLQLGARRVAQTGAQNAVPVLGRRAVKGKRRAVLGAQLLKRRLALGTGTEHEKLVLGGERRQLLRRLDLDHVAPIAAVDPAEQRKRHAVQLVHHVFDAAHVVVRHLHQPTSAGVE